MKFNKLAEKAKQAIDRRGGMDALKQDLQEVKEAATGRGSLRDKARAAADALKTPGRNPTPGEAAAEQAPPAGGAASAAPRPDPSGPTTPPTPPTTPPSAA